VSSPRRRETSFSPFKKEGGLISKAKLVGGFVEAGKAYHSRAGGNLVNISGFPFSWG